MEALLIAIQLSLVDCEARRLAGAVAVLGDDRPVASAAAVAGIDAEAAELAADRLTAAGLLAARRPLGFASAALRSATYALLEPGARAIYHRRAARLLGADGACHALAVEPAGDADLAEALVEAGARALAAGQPDGAVRLLDRALAEPPADPAAARLLLARALLCLGDPRAATLAGEGPLLADALWLSGDADGALAVWDAPPSGIAACDRHRPAAEVVDLARAGASGETALERCCAIAALLTCDELDAADAALASCIATADAAGACAERTQLDTLRRRLAAVRDGDPSGSPRLAGPDPGPEPLAGLPSARAAGLVAAARSAVGSRRVELLEQAVAELRLSPRRGALAAAVAELGRTLRHAGERIDSRAVLREGLDLAVRIGASELAAQCRDELRIAGARPRRSLLSGPESLTAAERRVVDAAAEGLSNREIAERLFLSRKTVEMHLGRTYRKLGIASRGELRAAA